MPDPIAEKAAASMMECAEQIREINELAGKIAEVINSAPEEHRPPLLGIAIAKLTKEIPMLTATLIGVLESVKLELFMDAYSAAVFASSIMAKTGYLEDLADAMMKSKGGRKDEEGS